MKTIKNTIKDILLSCNDGMSSREIIEGVLSKRAAERISVKTILTDLITAQEVKQYKKVACKHCGAAYWTYKLGKIRL